MPKRIRARSKKTRKAIVKTQNRLCDRKNIAVSDYSGSMVVYSDILRNIVIFQLLVSIVENVALLILFPFFFLLWLRHSDEMKSSIFRSNNNFSKETQKTSWYLAYLLFLLLLKHLHFLESWWRTDITLTILDG